MSGDEDATEVGVIGEARRAVAIGDVRRVAGDGDLGRGRSAGPHADPELFAARMRLLDAETLGFGASGRNGGQVIPGAIVVWGEPEGVGCDAGAPVLEMWLQGHPDAPWACACWP